MTPIAQKQPEKQPGRSPANAESGKDTGQLLKAGFWLILTALVSLLLIKTIFGGIGEHGPHTNGGWILLILAMTCLPLGGLLALLGGAKWFSKRRL